MSGAASRSWRTGWALPTLFALAAFATFVGLGTWQLQRKAWKEALIDTLEQRLAASPVDLPGARALAEPRSGRRRVPPGQILRRVPARTGGARLWQRIGLAQRRVRTRLLGVRAGEACGRRPRGRQSRFRAGRTAGSGRSFGSAEHRHDRDGRRDALAGAARDVHREGGCCAQSLVCARPARDRRRQGLGRGRTLLCRAREPAAGGRPAARGRAQGRSAQCASAICDHLVRTRRGRGGDVRILAARPPPHRGASGLPCESRAFQLCFPDRRLPPLRPARNTSKFNRLR